MGTRCLGLEELTVDFAIDFGRFVVSEEFVYIGDACRNGVSIQCQYVSVYIVSIQCQYVSVYTVSIQCQYVSVYIVSIQCQYVSVYIVSIQCQYVSVY